ncbi:amino acid adenylation domain-containing protein [Nocardia colli]|uniref:amino acid adenylation domain-containing protein n=1 Tax=Nocardia colli TaxID=2545717 RepID=UPI00168D50F6|nr:amino acid adenylation domain-containing protein [Nocardia colli]
MIIEGLSGNVEVLLHEQYSVAALELRGRTVERSFRHGIPGLVRAAATRAPGAIAAADGCGELTYRELELRSDRVARLLRTSAPRGRTVAIAVPRGAALLVALLGVLKAGLPYLLVDPSASTARMRQVTEISDCAVALVTGAGRELVVECGLRALDLPRESDTDELDPLPEVPADQPAYVLFTSGSTGAPKGVVVSVRALGNRLEWMRETYGVDADDRILQKTPVSVDVSGWELLLPLIAGARCVFLASAEHRDPVAVAQAVVRHQITICHFVPSMLREFLRWPDAARCTSLRHVFCGGEPLPAPVAREFVATLPAALHNLYGPAEAAIDVTAWTCPSNPADIDAVYIGRPIDNCVLTVLDADGLPVCPGEEGELHIGGVPVAAGYLNRPDLTARAFVAAPEGSSVPRLYRTGDRVRVVDGELEYLGSVDEQVTIRGQRIEPGEIEQHLLADPGVAAAVVVAVDVDDDTTMVAWIQPADTDCEPEALFRRLRACLSQQLPSASVPSRFVRTRRIPLTCNGKQDRAQLRRRAVEQVHARPAVIAQPDGPNPALRQLIRH